MWTEDDIKEKLKEVMDPEIQYNIVDLGLIYGAEVLEDQTVKVKMTLTSPMCPMGPQILSAVHGSVKSLPMVKDVKIDLVWTPPWDPRTMATEDARMHLGIE
jgi:metal-sulfur cluster biosynthetic enzyme